MSAIELVEIDIPDCYFGKTRHFIWWRLAIAEMTGVSLRYVISEKVVSLRLEGPNPAPTRLPFVEAAVDSSTLNEQLTPQRRFGHWESLPPDPLLILLVLTLPGGVIRHHFADAIADRLHEMTELMYGIDNGSWGMVDLGRFTESMQSGMRRISKRRVDSVIHGLFEPLGWWDKAGPFE